MLMSSTVSELNSLSGLAGAKRAIQSLTAKGGVNAVLFFGAPGSGKTTLARLLAKAWLCKNPSNEGACGQCNVCIAFDADQCMDVQVIEPYGAGRMLKLSCLRPVTPPDKDFTGIPLSTYFMTRPMMARHKIIILEQIDRLNVHSANAALKEIEELGAHAKLILTTSELARVLPTIRSRCLCVACESPETLESSVNDSLSTFVSSVGDQRRVESEVALFSQLDSFFGRVLSSPRGAALRLATEARDLASQIESSQKIGSRQANLDLLNLAGIYFARQAAERPDVTQAVAEAHRLVEQNGNAQLIFEDLFIQILI